MVKRIIALMNLTAGVVGLLGSCNNATSESSTTTSDVAYLSGIKLGAMKRTLHTTSSTGADSTYTVGVSLANIPMAIDHNGGRIYNATPLPTGTDLSRVNFSTITATGVIGIKSIASAIDTAFTTKDTFDVRQPREVFVYSTSGKVRHTYSLSLTVAQEEADSLLWTAVPTATSFYGLTQPRLVAVGDTLHLFGEREGTVAHYTSADGGVWQTQATAGLTATALPSITVQGTTLWTAETGVLSRSADGGRTWERVSTTFTPKALLAVSGTAVYVVASDKQVYALAGTSVTPVAVEEAEGLPTSVNNSVVLPASTTAAEQLVAIGRNATGQMVAYGKYENLPAGTSRFYPMRSDASAQYSLPQWQAVYVARLERALLAVGLSDAVPTLYSSRDAGLTWQSTTAYRLPDNVTATTSVAFANDANGRLWLIDVAHSQVWRGQMGQ